jgi:DNA-binding LacI/PurR family transcriptional regulator
LDNRPFDYLGLPMSTLEIPWDAVAENAVEMLLAKIENPRMSLPSRAVAYSPEIRGGTCAPPPPPQTAHAEA